MKITFQTNGQLLYLYVNEMLCGTVHVIIWMCEKDKYRNSVFKTFIVRLNIVLVHDKVTFCLYIK